jgi:lactoylglutathione lyase
MKRLPYIIAVLLACLNHANAQQKKPMPQLNHIAVYVVDLEKSTRFYQQVIGLDTIPEPFHDGRHTWFSIGAKSQLHIISGAAQPTSHNKNTHLCFSVQSIEDFIIGLKNHKVAFEDWAGTASAVTTRPDGVKQIWFRDPDGYWLEINNARE